MNRSIPSPNRYLTNTFCHPQKSNVIKFFIITSLFTQNHKIHVHANNIQNQHFVLFWHLFSILHNKKPTTTTKLIIRIWATSKDNNFRIYFLHLSLIVSFLSTHTHALKLKSFANLFNILSNTCTFTPIFIIILPCTIFHIFFTVLAVSNFSPKYEIKCKKKEEEMNR